MSHETVAELPQPSGLSEAVPPHARRSVTFIDGLVEIASGYDLLLCDVWGVLHDGVKAFPAASQALGRYRAGGGKVVLVSNAPRPGEDVIGHLTQLGVARDAFDAIRTSGDLTRDAVAESGARPFHHVGPERDLGLFRGLSARPAGLDKAEYVVCTGLFADETETVADYADRLREMKARNLPMICANPDLVVERGDRLILCAGALAAAYEEIGGRTVTYGKPHPPVYASALAVGAGLLGRQPDLRRVLAVGDAVRTDIAGGNAAGLDTLLVARGIHAAELGLADGLIDREVAAAWIGQQAVAPTFATHELVWGGDA
ncbi:TIGR01459 family HAD-type hydrolase [uncultured Enterovirga sp.]|uniref:TIGR01459 family HAD-type hydrolase n=1 Tax=uncultured Enterovirga sp. TaxID=2026352 RepID=UPI0035CA86E1